MIRTFLTGIVIGALFTGYYTSWTAKKAEREFFFNAGNIAAGVEHDLDEKFIP